MKTKYVCRGLISMYVNFCNNRTMWSKNLHVKICRWGGGEGKRAKLDNRTTFLAVKICRWGNGKRAVIFVCTLSNYCYKNWYAN